MDDTATYFGVIGAELILSIFLLFLLGYITALGFSYLGLLTLTNDHVIGITIVETIFVLLGKFILTNK